MKKPHLFSSEEPWQQWGIQLQADCGREIAEAHWMAAVDSNSDIWLSGRNICQKCQGGKHQRYLYVITEGQEALDEAV